MTSSGRPIVVAIDGPAGVGKSTIAMAVARELELTYVETGALYRAVGLLTQREGLNLEAEEEVAGLAAAMEIAFRLDGELNRVYLSGEDVTMQLRAPQMGPAASIVSAQPAVRQALLDLQRDFGTRGNGAVAEGRDIGTVVFPQATFKFFLEADVEERARRRHLQLEAMGRHVSVAELVADLAVRDERDRNRAVAPLKPAADAVIVDSTHLNADEVIAAIMGHIRDRKS